MYMNADIVNREFIMKSFQQYPLPRERPGASTSSMDNPETGTTSGQPNEEIHGCLTEEEALNRATKQVRISRYRKPPSSIDTETRITSEQPNEEIQGCSTEAVALNRTTEQVATSRTQKNPPSSYSVIEVFLLTLVLAWPLTFLCLGIVYFDKCPAQDKLPLVTIMTACAGTLPIIMRVIKVIWIDRLSDVIRHRCGHLLMILEAIFLLFFCPYNAMLFSVNPSYDSSRDDYCNYYFYNLNFNANFFSIVFLAFYIVARLLPRVIRRFAR
ncbi:hypothetical protein TNCT_484501 [Trichonephila clavata]|uniref:Uncharacterized protein n=1 Tax=Trichonephila clavata TaxID=2740835 RepID=A0A8X6H2X4_TRICU|nr:hypothetical protein TNCT_484501 [Trichonephila clavata]